MASVPLGAHDAGGFPVHDDDDAVPWLHCPVIVDDGDTAPLPPEYCAGLLSEYPGLPGAAPPASPHHGAAVPASRAAPPEAAAKQAPPSAGEGVMNFTFFSRPLQQRPQASAAAAPSNPVESTVVQAATNRLRSTPLFSEQRMAWLQPPKAPRATAAGAPPAPQAPLPPELRHGEAATVTQRRLQPEARAPDAAAGPAAVTTSSVCSGNGDRSQPKRSSHHQLPDCSVSPDEDLDDEGGATRRSESRSNKRSRTAEVHNLSERRRRDRINEKMRALQELIPNCNKAHATDTLILKWNPSSCFIRLAHATNTLASVADRQGVDAGGGDRVPEDPAAAGADDVDGDGSVRAADAAAGDADAAPHGGALPPPRHGAGVQHGRGGGSLRHGPRCRRALPVPSDGNAARADVRRARAGDAAAGRRGVRSHGHRAARADGSCSCTARSRSGPTAGSRRHTGRSEAAASEADVKVTRRSACCCRSRALS
ncbi:hypothetical protein SEVIR_3G056500v4 [Setaria viridis]